MKNLNILALSIFLSFISQTTTTLASQNTASQPSPEQIEKIEAKLNNIGRKMRELTSSSQTDSSTRRDSTGLAIGACLVALSASSLSFDYFFARTGSNHMMDGLKELRSNKQMLSKIVRSPITRQSLKHCGIAGIPLAIGSFLVYSTISNMPHNVATFTSDTKKLMSEIKKPKSDNSTNA